MARYAEPVPDYILELYAQGELPPEDMEALDRRRTADAEFADRLDQLRQSNEEILAAYPARAFAVAVEERRAGTAGKPWRWIAVAPAVAAAAALLLWVVPDEVVLLKGAEPKLEVYRLTGDVVEPLEEDAVAEAGDMLQLSYNAFGRPYGMILSIDGRGTVTMHLPDSVGQSTALDSSGEILIPHSYELDDAPDFERFYLILGQEPIPVSEILEQARRMAAASPRTLQLPEEYEVYKFAIRKKETSS